MPRGPRIGGGWRCGQTLSRPMRSAVILTFHRLYGDFDAVIETDVRAMVQRSAARHAAWTRGDFDHLT